MSDLEINDWLVIPDRDLRWSAVRASGPGGQNVNQVATKIDLRFDLEACEVLSSDVKERLRKLAVGRFDAEGRLVITSQASRTQAQNLEDARSKLAVLIRRALVPPRRRKPTKPSRGARMRRLGAKREQSEKKASRGRVRSDD